MKAYWARIILGALAIFAIGMLIRAGVHKARNQVHSITETSEPITIPFPLGIMPFKLDGDRLGNVERVTLMRDTPKGISNIRVVVKLADSIPAGRLENCFLVIDDPERINEHTTFRCQDRDTTGLKLVPYGDVSVDGQDASFPLLLTQVAVAKLHSDSASDQMEENADSIADAAEAYADSMSELADSITSASNEMADSIRSAAMERADSIRQAARSMADSLRQARRAVPSRPRRPR